jgi:hypothetical protein
MQTGGFGAKRHKLNAADHAASGLYQERKDLKVARISSGLERSDKK